MEIQIIGSNWGYRTGFSGIVQSSLAKPRSLDEFDVNVLDLSCEKMWENHSNSYSTVDNANDLASVRQMVINSKKTKIIYVLPRSIAISYDFISGKGTRRKMIKDHIEMVRKNILGLVMTPQLGGNTLCFENTRTNISDLEYEADFYFINYTNVQTKSKLSEKATTVSLNDRVMATALDITTSIEKLQTFVNHFFAESASSNRPNWFNNISFFDDNLHREIISERQAEIARATQAIQDANAKLRENEKYKSILYTNGSELVGTVFDILEQLLGYDLSEFEDKKNEDFLIRLENCTLIGEIKGVTSNVKNDHIGQIEHHYQRYMDEFDEKGIAENVHQILIINPFRTKAPDTREPINEKQINLARRNGCLIIETSTLLKMFEYYLKSRITTEKCIEVFCNKTGLLQITDIPIEHQGDIEDFMG